MRSEALVIQKDINKFETAFYRWVTMEYHNEQTTKTRIYSEDRYKIIETESTSRLKEIAVRQHWELEVA